MNWALLFAAGVLGGLTGSIAGLASVATYPALLLVGLPPVKTVDAATHVELMAEGLRTRVRLTQGSPLLASAK